MREDESTSTLEQSRFRDANDRLRQAATRYRFEPADRVPFICECADPACFETVMLNLEDCLT